MWVVGDSALAGTYLPVAVGAVLGAAGSLIYLRRTKAFSAGATDRVTAAERRHLSIRIVVALYAAIAYACLLVAVALGDSTFILFTAAIALLATLAIARLWSGR